MAFIDDVKVLFLFDMVNTSKLTAYPKGNKNNNNWKGGE